MSESREEPIDPSINELPTGGDHHSAEEEEAHAAKLKKQAKKAAKKHGESDEGLNIVALMDAFTIILVFLIKSYQSDPTTITQDDNMTVPQSSTTLMIVEAVPLVITKKSILVADQAVVKLVDGSIDPTERQGFGVPRVAEALKKEADKHKMIARFNSKVKFEGMLLVVADKGTKFQTITDVLFTAGQVEFGKFKFAVLRLD
jgi:biopolymer transport protein ExbD